MREAGIDLEDAKPQLLTSELGDGTRLLVTMAPSPQMTRKRSLRFRALSKVTVVVQPAAAFFAPSR